MTGCSISGYRPNVSLVAEGYVNFIFEDASNWLHDVFMYNHLLCPSKFDLKVIIACISEFLERTPVEIV